jgi:outer membrane protein OmpA-like peptidoglycan-associated protein
MHIFFSCLWILIISCNVVLADAVIPKADLKGASDLSWLGRYQGAFIVAHRHKAFDRFIIPTAPLKAVPEKRDSHNNIVFSPAKSRRLEGEHTRLVYLLPAGRTPLEAVANYQQAIKEAGGSVLFSCEQEGCGGDPGRASSGGGGNMSLGMFFESEEEITSYNDIFDNGYCALTSRITGQQYISAEIPSRNAWLAILAYSVRDDSFCKALNRRTVVVLDVLTAKAMEQKMVVVKAREMQQKMSTQGKIALYGIYFDTARAELKEKSRPTLKEIASLLTAKPGLNILVVGHTDNKGTFAYNQTLSQQRAEAVVRALHKDFNIRTDRLKAVGVGFACPAAPNTTKEGRAKNRRVELVPR